LRAVGVRVAVAALALGVASGGATGAPDLFRVDKSRPTRVLVIDGPDATTAPAGTHPMLGEAAGVRHELSAKDIAGLLAAGVDARPAEKKGSLHAIATLRCIGPESERDYRILRDDRAGVFAIEMDPMEGGSFEGEPRELDAEKLRELLLAWPAARAARSEPALKAGATVRLEGNSGRLAPSAIFLDAPTLRERFTFGKGSGVAPARRALGEESMLVRLPEGHDERIACGLVVYLHPGPQTLVPGALVPVLDELGFVCIAPDNVPNTRDRTDRMQLALDAVATAVVHTRIDRERVYFVGLSGGGKIGTHVWTAAPEVVRGGVAMVAIGSYEHLKRDDGKMWRGDFFKPPTRVLRAMRASRLAAITGDLDENQDYIRKSVGVMRGDGLDVRLFDFADLGHQMPSAERVGEALRWVDEKARAAREAAIARAKELLAGVAAEGPAREAGLRAVMDEAPWSEPAWAAAGMIGR
jgi:pimeloyl-ACP methyl ester carboxylesterase